MAHSPQVTEVMGPVTFKLNLPKTWKIHPVFHAALLTPFRTTKEHGPDYPRPPPETIEGEAEHEVEAILKHRTIGKKRKTLQYFVCFQDVWSVLQVTLWFPGVFC